MAKQTFRYGTALAVRCRRLSRGRRGRTGKPSRRWKSCLRIVSAFAPSVTAFTLFASCQSSARIPSLHLACVVQMSQNRAQTAALVPLYTPPSLSAYGHSPLFREPRLCLVPAATSGHMLRGFRSSGSSPSIRPRWLLGASSQAASLPFCLLLSWKAQQPRLQCSKQTRRLISMRPSHSPLAAPPLSNSLSHPVGPSSPSLSGHRRSSARRLPWPLLVVTIACRSFSASPATSSASAAWAGPRNLPAPAFCMRADTHPGSLRRAPANKPPRPSLGLR